MEGIQLTGRPVGTPVAVATVTNDEVLTKPSSLIAVHRLSLPDRHYDLQLMRDVEIANRLTSEYRPSCATNAERAKSAVADTNSTLKQSEVVDGMTKTKSALLTVLGMTCIAPVAIAARDRGEIEQQSARGAMTDKPELSSEYKQIEDFSHFRQKLISDGWKPVPNPECHDAVVGGDYENYCRAKPSSAGCRACELVPEILKSTSDGYTLARYEKNGVLLNVTAYGDIRDLENPGRYGLDVIGWRFGDSLNVVLLEEGAN